MATESLEGRQLLVAVLFDNHRCCLSDCAGHQFDHGMIAVGLRKWIVGSVVSEYDNIYEPIMLKAVELSLSASDMPDW